MFKLEKVKKQLALFIAFIALIQFYGCTEEEVEKEEKLYQMELKYDTSSGDVAVEPALEQYPENTMVRLSASPKDGYDFLGWKSDNVIISENQEISIKMSDNIGVVAYFESKTIQSIGEKFYVIASGELRKGDVEISPDKFVYSYGETVTVTATPKEGYKFIGWISNDVIISTEQTMTFNVVENTEINALFDVESSASDETYALKVSCNSDQGVVTVYPEKDVYNENETVTISATPKEGYVFKEWKGISGASNIFDKIQEDQESTGASEMIMVKMTNDFDITAIFEKVGNVSVTTSDIIFDFKGSYDEATGNWTFSAFMKDDSKTLKDDDQYISDATIKINDEYMLSGVAFNNPRFEGNYYYLVMEYLGPDEVLNMSVKKGDIDFNKVIKTPSFFTDDRNLEVRIKDTDVIIDWQKLDCNSYQVNNSVEQTGRGYSAKFLSPPMSENHFETSLSALLANSSNITNPEKVGVWVVPMNIYNQLDGFHGKSTIHLNGKKSDVRIWNRR